MRVSYSYDPINLKIILMVIFSFVEEDKFLLQISLKPKGLDPDVICLHKLSLGLQISQIFLLKHKNFFLADTFPDHKNFLYFWHSWETSFRPLGTLQPFGLLDLSTPEIWIRLGTFGQNSAKKSYTHTRARTDTFPRTPLMFDLHLPSLDMTVTKQVWM